MRNGMATDTNLERTLVMLDEAVEPDEQADISRAQQLAEQLDVPFDPLTEFQVSRTNVLIPFFHSGGT